MMKTQKHQQLRCDFQDSHGGSHRSESCTPHQQLAVSDSKLGTVRGKVYASPARLRCSLGYRLPPFYVRVYAPGGTP